MNTNDNLPRPFARRNFLATGAPAAAAISLVPRHVLGGPKFIAPSEKVNIAIIGCGGQGRTNVRNLFNEADAQIIAVADPTEGFSLDKFYYRGLGGRKPVKAEIEKHYAEFPRRRASGFSRAVPVRWRQTGPHHGFFKMHTNNKSETKCNCRAAEGIVFCSCSKEEHLKDWACWRFGIEQPVSCQEKYQAKLEAKITLKFPVLPGLPGALPGGAFNLEQGSRPAAPRAGFRRAGNSPRQLTSPWNQSGKLP